MFALQLSSNSCIYLHVCVGSDHCCWMPVMFMQPLPEAFSDQFSQPAGCQLKTRQEPKFQSLHRMLIHFIKVNATDETPLTFRLQKGFRKKEALLVHFTCFAQRMESKVLKMLCSCLHTPFLLVHKWIHSDFCPLGSPVLQPWAQ